MAAQSVTAVFNGGQDTVAVTWSAMAGNFAVVAGVTVTDSNGPVVPWLTARTATGCTVNVSDRFTGTVELAIIDKP